MSRADRFDSTVVAVVAVALVALFLRVVDVGSRPFHWDEARVGVWALHFARTGLFEYRPVAGGPLPYHLARTSFALFGPSDAAARLPIALVGGLLPLSALGLRGRLRDDETVFLAVLLALSPVLLYYGRFLRGDFLLVAAAFAAVVFGLRAVDTGRPVFAYGAVLAVAASVAASGFVVATVICVVGAGALTLDGDRLSTVDLLARPDRLADHSTVLARAFLLLVGTLVFLFAPRGGTVSLWSPTTFPSVLDFVFVEAPGRFFAVRIASRWAAGATHELIPYVTSLGRTLLTAASVTLVLGLFGFARERYLGGRRAVVLFFAFWAGVGLLVYPMTAEVDAPWTAVHVVVPLAVPAAVGAAALFSAAREAISRDDAATVAALLLLVVAGVVQVGGVVTDDVYGPPSPDSALAQYAQPADSLEPFEVNISESDDGPAVLYYGDRFHTGTWTEADGPPVPDAWGERLPLAWYVARAGSESTSLPSDATLPDNPPPVVVTDPGEAERVRSQLSEYERAEYRLALWNRKVVVFVRQ